MSRIFAVLPLAVALLLLISPVVRAIDVHYCEENAEYEIQVKEVEISPNPIAPGEPVTFTISANTGREISFVKLVIEVSYFGWHVHSETHDLCIETTCPIQTGDFLVSHSQVLPGYTPPGSYSLKMKMLDAQKKELTCIRFSFDIGLRSFVADI
ncbi:PREDICTED: phosphatidylglycerol/phosphatidylinositol transfer protein-like [Camelina sativa]|uniref:Phosphatidylglycerol/phosphatidylinositol transfer protein-like n=1 Tax=Camelina sativa TaxID=90675 RepID=A0ABM0TAK0_CAMSA|nr:PREDICTED: phosphatidylglycerol/phosphatidylinositol transfer protein-like [Camelina sativa]